MTSEADLDYRKGRNLVWVSFVIIVYILSGAHFVEDGIFAGLALRFEHPEVLKIARVGGIRKP